MEIDTYQVLKDNGLILLFLVIGCGYLIGNIRIFGMPLSPTIGVLLTGLFFGHHHLNLPAAVGSFGFALFIFSVGLQMNPVLLLGSLTGSMTSTPALVIVTEAARSGVPAIGYAGTYPLPMSF